ncbi:terminase small subunit [Azonexus hydrophilus]
MLELHSGIGIVLTPKQQKFVDAYSLSGNATQALAAGYSERTACKIAARTSRN